MHTRSFRDRHGRGLRGPLTPYDVPRFRTRSNRFDNGVLEAYAPILNSYPDELSGLDIAVDTVPRMRLTPDALYASDDIVADGPVPLGRLLPAGVDAQDNPTRARIVVFRRPVEQRCSELSEQQELLTWILTQLVAAYLNIDPQRINPDVQP